MNLKYTTLYIN